MCKVLIHTLAVLLLTLYFNPTLAGLDCTDLSEKACTAKFAAQFDQETKEMYGIALKRIFITLVEAYNATVAELPTNDKFYEPIKKKVTELNTKIQEIEHGQVEVKDVVFYIVNRDVNVFDIDVLDTDDYPLSQKAYELYHKYGYSQYGATVNEVLDFLHIRISEIWSNLFNGLGPDNLTNFNEIQDLDLIYKAIELAVRSKEIFYYYVVRKTPEVLDVKFLAALNKERYN